MLLIVAHHFIVNSGVLQILDSNPNSWRSVALYLEGAWGKTAINGFVLITGWFMCKSHITARKFLKLLLEVVFYNIVCNAAFMLYGYHYYNFRELLLIFWPISDIGKDFISCYLVFFLLIPFLNILVHHMDRRSHLMLVTLCLGVYTILGSVPTIRVEFNYVTWFCILYLISSWLRLYEYPYKHDVRFWTWAMFGSLFLAVCSILFIALIVNSDGYRLGCYALLGESNKVLAVLLGVTSFMFFANINIPRSRLINTVAASTFGVLLIHANSDIMRHWLWVDVCNVAGHYTSAHFWPSIILVPPCIFVVCIMIDHLRLRYLEPPVLNYACSLVHKISSLVLKIHD